MTTKQILNLMTLTQDDVAEKLGVSQSAVSQWSTGATQPDIENVRKLARLAKYDYGFDNHGRPKFTAKK